jgi:hypothetical protein
VAEAHLDHPGGVSWWVGNGPAPILGDCPHECEHRDTRTVAWGPDFEHYELVECLDTEGCAAGGRNTTGVVCRGWSAEHPRDEAKRLGLPAMRTHGWKQIDRAGEHKTTRKERIEQVRAR